MNTISFLDKLCLKINSDKGLYYYNNSNIEEKIPGHNYTKIYEKIFKEFRNKHIKLLEIGVSLWYKNINENVDLKPDYIGSEIWKTYFPNGTICGYDINKYESSKNVKFYRGDQSCIKCLNKIEETEFDIIIDDGSHARNHQQFTFFSLFDKIKKDGLYIIEDCHSNFDYLNDDNVTYNKNYGVYNSYCSICNNFKFEPQKKGISTFELLREWYYNRWIIPDENNNFMSSEEKENFVKKVKNNIEIQIFLTDRFNPSNGIQYVTGTIDKPLNGSIMIVIKKLY